MHAMTGGAENQNEGLDAAMVTAKRDGEKSSKKKKSKKKSLESDSEAGISSSSLGDGPASEHGQLKTQASYRLASSNKLQRMSSKIGASMSFKRQSQSHELPPSLQPRRPDNFIRERFNTADDNTLPLSTRSRNGYSHAEASFKSMNSRQSFRALSREQSRTTSKASFDASQPGKNPQSHEKNAWLLLHSTTEHSILEEEQVDSQSEARPSRNAATSRSSQSGEQTQAQTLQEKQMEEKIRETGKELGFQSFRAKTDHASQRRRSSGGASARSIAEESHHVKLSSTASKNATIQGSNARDPSMSNMATATERGPMRRKPSNGTGIPLEKSEGRALTPRTSDGKAPEKISLDPNTLSSDGCDLFTNNARPPCLSSYKMQPRKRSRTLFPQKTDNRSIREGIIRLDDLAAAKESQTLSSVSIPYDNRLRMLEVEAVGQHLEEPDTDRLTWKTSFSSSARGTQDRDETSINKDAESHLSHSHKMLRDGNLRSALWHVTRAGTLAPQNPKILLKRAQILAQIGLWTETYRDCSHVLAMAMAESIHVRHSAVYLRARASSELEAPRHAEAVRELLGLKADVRLEPKFRPRVLLALAKSKHAFAIQEGRSRQEALDILAWALEDLAEVKKIQKQGLLLTKGDANSISDRLARINLDLYRISHQSAYLDATIASAAEAASAGHCSLSLVNEVISCLLLLGDHSQAADFADQYVNMVKTRRAEAYSSRKEDGGKLVPARPTANSGSRKRTSVAGRKTRVSGGSTARQRPSTSSATNMEVLQECNSLVLRAQTLACNVKFIDAEKDLREALKLVPGHVEASCLLAEVLERQGQPERGKRVLSDVTTRRALMTPRERALILRVRHELHIACKQPDEALRDLQRLHGKSELLHALGQAEAAYSSLRLAEVCRGYLRDAEGARRILNRVESCCRGDVLAKMAPVRAMIAMQRGEHNLAILEFSKAIYFGAEVKPALYVCRARCCTSIGRFAEAIKDLQTFAHTAFDTGHAQRDFLQHKLSTVASISPQESLAPLFQACVAAPSEKLLELWFLALFKVAAHDKAPLYTRAAFVTDLAKELEETGVVFAAGLARTLGCILHQVGEFDRAIEYYTIALSQTKSNKSSESTMMRQHLLILLGSCHAQLTLQSSGNCTKTGRPSLSAFSEAIKHWTNAAAGGGLLACIHLGDLHLMCGEARAATRHYQAYTISDADDRIASGLLVRQSCAFAELKQHGCALELLTEAIRLDPGNANASYNLGIAYELADDFSRAALAYTSALKIDAGMQAARLRKAIVHIRLEAPENALEELEFLRGRSPQHSFFTTLLAAHCCLATRQFAKAINLAATLTRVQPSTSACERAALKRIEGAALLGLCQRELGHFGRMERGEAKRSAAAGPSFARKKTLFRLKSARDVLLEGVHLDPAHQAHTRINLGLCGILSSRGREAQTNFNIAIQMNKARNAGLRLGDASLQTAIAGLALSHLVQDEVEQARLVLEAFSCPPHAQNRALQIAFAVTLHACGHISAACQAYEAAMHCFSSTKVQPGVYAAEVQLLAAAAALRRRAPSQAQTLTADILQQPQLQQHVAARLVLAVSLTMQGQFAPAARILDSSRDPSGQDQTRQFYLLFNRATLHGHLGNAWQSVRDCEAALRLDPGAMALKLLKAHMLVHQHRTRDALDVFQDIFDTDETMLAAVNLQT